MAKICNVCGSEMQDTDKFCNYCGTPNTPETPAAPAAPAADNGYAYAQQPVATATNNGYAAPVNNGYAQQPAAPTGYGYAQQPAGYPPVAPPPAQPEIPKAGLGVGAFFGFGILFSIPFVGFILIMIMSFALKNKTLKNFARSYLIWYIIAIVIVVIALIFSLIVGVSLFEEIEYLL